MKKLSHLVFYAVLLFTIFSNDLKSQTPVGNGQTYQTLKSAFDAINAGTLKGDVVLKITSSITESATASLNASGTSSANYTSVVIYPDGVYTINGNISGSMIRLKGADRVTFNGSVNQGNTSKDLTLQNSNTSNAVIEFTEDACNNTVKFCKIKGANSTSNYGIVYFAGGISTGNDNNTVDNCSIDGNGSTRYCILSGATSGKENTANTVSNCEIFDFFQSSNAFYGIRISSYSNNWTINNNSFYQTQSRDFSNYFRAIALETSSIDGITITNNKIGGTGANCSGGAMTLTGSGILQLIYTNSVSTGVSIQGNTIKNISFTSSNTSALHALIIHGTGSANIGNTSGNTLGDQSSTGNISVSLSGSGSVFQGVLILLETRTNINISNNTIGGINFGITGSPSTIPKFYGIYTQGAATTNTISGNTIGSSATSNSISSNANSVFYGIYSQCNTSGQSISNNLIANVQLTSTSTGNKFTGIYTPGNSGGSFSISENTVRDISSSSTNTGVSESASVVGIVMNAGSTGGQTVSENIIYSLSNTCPTQQVEISGIYYAGPTSGSNIIENNKINSINLYNTNANANIFGIRVGGGTTKYVNNMVCLGTDATGTSNINPNKIYGIYDGSGTNDYYYNSLCLGGTGVTGSASQTYAFYSLATNTRNFKNNIFANTRSNGTGTGKHYAVRYTSGGSLTADYNDIYVSGTGGKFGYYSGDVNDLAAWRTATSKDANSVSTALTFMSITDLHVDISAVANLSGIGGKGTSVSGITSDIDGNTRKSIPDIGASEFTLEQTGSIENGGTTDHKFGATQRGAITWHGSDLPASVSFAYLGNVIPPGGAAGDKVNQFWSCTNTGGTTFSYDIMLYYDDSYLNGIPESDLRIAKSEDGGNTYTVYTSYGTGTEQYVISTNENWVKVHGLTSFSIFTLTDNNHPLPVKVSEFSAVVNSSDVKLNWTTESELNNTGFEVERSVFNEHSSVYTKIGFVKGYGNKYTPSRYEFEDRKMETGVYQYRLKQIDFNGNFEYFYMNGKVEVGVPVKFSLGQNYPNPFNPSTKIDFDLPVDSRVMLVVYDVTGREVARLINNESKKPGYYTAEFDAGSFSSGVYFYRLSTEAFVQTRKMVVLR